MRRARNAAHTYAAGALGGSLRRLSDLREACVMPAGAHAWRTTVVTGRRRVVMVGVSVVAFAQGPNHQAAAVVARRADQSIMRASDAGAFMRAAPLGEVCPRRAVA